MSHSSNLFCMQFIRTVFLRALRFFRVESAGVLQKKDTIETFTDKKFKKNPNICYTKMARSLISKRFEQSLFMWLIRTVCLRALRFFRIESAPVLQKKSYDRKTDIQKNSKKIRTFFIKKFLVLSFPNDLSNLFFMWLIRTVFLRALRFFRIESAGVFQKKIMIETLTDKKILKKFRKISTKNVSCSHFQTVRAISFVCGSF